MMDVQGTGSGDEERRGRRGRRGGRRQREREARRLENAQQNGNVDALGSSTIPTISSSSPTTTMVNGPPSAIRPLPQDVDAASRAAANPSVLAALIQTATTQSNSAATLAAMSSLRSVAFSKPCSTVLIRGLPFTRQRDLLRNVLIRFIMGNIAPLRVARPTTSSTTQMDKDDDTNNNDTHNARYYGSSDVSKAIIAVRICKPTSRSKRDTTRRKIATLIANNKMPLPPPSRRHAQRTLQAFVTFTDVNLAKAIVVTCQGKRLLTMLAPEDVILGKTNAECEAEHANRKLSGRRQPRLDTLLNNLKDQVDDTPDPTKDGASLAHAREEIRRDPRKFVHSSADYYREFKGNDPLIIEFARVDSNATLRHQVYKKLLDTSESRKMDVDESNNTNNEEQTNEQQNKIRTYAIMWLQQEASKCLANLGQKTEVPKSKGRTRKTKAAKQQSVVESDKLDEDSLCRIAALHGCAKEILQDPKIVSIPSEYDSHIAALSKKSVKLLKTKICHKLLAKVEAKERKRNRSYSRKLKALEDRLVRRQQKHYELLLKRMLDGAANAATSAVSAVTALVNEPSQVASS